MSAVQDFIDQVNDFDINDIDWSRMGVWPTSAKIVFALLIAAILIGGCYFFFVKDLTARLDRVVKEEATLKTSFESKAFQAANLEKYQEQMVQMEASFGALVAQLPSDTEVPGLLEDIDEKGSSSGLIIKSIKLGAEAPQEFYIELPITVEVSGTYHDFGTFVSGIAGMPRIVTLHDYEVDYSAEQNGLLDMTILAKTYRYKEQAE